MKKKQALKDLSFADLVAMRRQVVDLKWHPRRSYDKWQVVQNSIEREMHRRINKL